MLTVNKETRSSRRRRVSPLQKKETLAAFMFISPWIVGFIVFTLGPMIASFYLSLTQYNVIQSPTFIGLDNYKELLKDPKIPQSLYNTFFYAVLHVPLSTALALGLALLLNGIKKGAGFFRTAFYLPSITPSVAIGVLFLNLLNMRVGLINRFLAMLGILGPAWSTDPAWIKPGIVIMSLWSIGSTIIIYLAALQDVPKDLYEAARIDGANAWHQFVKITVPMISGTIFFTMIVNTISSIQIFTEVYTMYFGTMSANTGQEAALFYIIYLFRNAFEYLKMGYASAMAWILFVIIMILTFIQLRMSKKWVYYEGE
jgi:multiple sugar transport system permease protein